MKRTLLLLVSLTLLLGIVAVSAESNYPTKPITMVVQANPGGLSDQVSQEIAMLMGKDLGVRITSVYKPGASGAVGMTYVEASPKDGYVIGHAPIEYVMVKTLGYANLEPESCTFLGQAYTTVPALTVNADDDRFSNMEEFFAYAKANPGAIRMGNAGAGSIWHLVALGIEQAADVKFTHVPFEGAAPAATALMGKHIDAIAIGPIEVKSGVDAGKLRVIGVAADERSGAFPEVPTLKEMDMDFSLVHWGGFIAPPGIPAEVEARLTESLKKAVESEEFATFLSERGMDPMFRGGEEAKAFVQEQYEYFQTAIPAAMGK